MKFNLDKKLNEELFEAMSEAGTDAINLAYEATNGDESLFEMCMKYYYEYLDNKIEEKKMDDNVIDSTARLEILEEFKYLTKNEIDVLSKLVNIMQHDSKTMPALKKAILNHKSLFIIFTIIGKRKNFNLNETKISILYNKYAYGIRELGFGLPLYQDLNKYFTSIEVDSAAFDKGVKNMDDQLRDFLNIHGTPNIDFIPLKEEAEESLKSINVSKPSVTFDEISDVAKDLFSKVDKLIDNSTELDFAKDLILLFGKDQGTIKTFGNKLKKGGSLKSLFERAIKRKPNEEVKNLFESFLESMHDTVENIKETEEVEEVENIKETEEVETEAKVEEDVVMKSYPKNILVDELNWKMLEIAQYVIDPEPFRIRSFDDYDKDEFNECFERMRKRHKHQILGKSLVLRDIIAMLNVRVDNKGHQMLSAIINKFEDTE